MPGRREGGLRTGSLVRVWGKILAVYLPSREENGLRKSDQALAGNIIMTETNDTRHKHSHNKLLIKCVSRPALLLPQMLLNFVITVFFLTDRLFCSGGFIIWTKQFQ